MTIHSFGARFAAFIFVFHFATIASAQGFAGPTAAVDLAGYRPDELTVPVEVVKPVAGPFDSVKLSLLNADAAIKGPVDHYEVEAEPATQAWRVDSISKTMQRKPVGRFRFAAGAIAFQWEAGITRVDGGPLRNCIVVIEDGATKHAVVLRAPVRQPAWPLDLKKDISRFALADDLPDAADLTLEVFAVAGTTTPVDIEPKKVEFKEPIFAVLKTADSTNAGARLRIAIWKSGIKPEVLVRPEITPMDGVSAAARPSSRPTLPGRPGQPSGASTGSGGVTFKQGGDVDYFNPTAAAKLNTLSFTPRSVADLRGRLNRELAAGESQFAANQNRIAANERELNKYVGVIVGTEEEIRAIRAKIDRLRSENRQLDIANRIWSDSKLPVVKRQIAACEPLESLANTLHGKATLSLRVTYQVQGWPIEALVVAGDAPAAGGAGPGR